MSATVIGAPRRRAADRPPQRARRKISKVAFYTHLWLGVLTTIGLIAIAITGILLNHKRGLGLMSEIEHAPTAALVSSQSLEQLAHAALVAAPQHARAS
jgi:hypothetical protein